MAAPAHSRHELAHDVLRHARRHPLDAIFAAKKVALIGATEAPGSVGLALMENLAAKSFGGAVYPIKPKRDSVLGIRAYPRVSAVPDQLDLAVIVTPAPTAPGLIAECAAANIPAAIIISAGFKEVGPSGVELEQQILAEARRGRMRVVGPNSLGVMVPHAALTATVRSARAR